MVLQAIKYSRGRLEILDQLRLPHEEIYINIRSCHEAWTAIKSMQVRGAPAIAIVAALSVAVEAAQCLLVQPRKYPSPQEAAQQLSWDLEYLMTSRPTAVNLADAATKLKAVLEDAAEDPTSDNSFVLEAYIRAAEQMLVDDVQDNKRIGEHGADWILRNKPHDAQGHKGTRLTGYELIHDGIPATLITDSMAAALLDTRRQSENIVAIVVGADRVAANGDTANKIGTYSLAVLARYHGVKFLVAAPRTTIDMETKNGASITIEERPEIEVLNIKGPPYQRNESGGSEVDTLRTTEICIAAKGTRAWNPAFDVTPARLIDGIVTEKGVVEKDQDGVFQWDKVFKKDAIEDVAEVDAPKPLGMAADGITATEPANATE
ncbi:MAG: hypothetical protein Q9218_000056 [Villophora microphyllina]